ncbi:hypothetical protein WUBG_10986, partial [Wuchereria bancrofti]
EDDDRNKHNEMSCVIPLSQLLVYARNNCDQTNDQTKQGHDVYVITISPQSSGAYYAANKETY